MAGYPRTPIALFACAVFGATLASANAHAQAQTPASWTQVGMLSCRLNPSIGFIIFGHQSMECQFTQNGRFTPQAYEGALNTVGIKTAFTMEFKLFSMFNNSVGNTQAFYFCLILVISHEF